MPQGRPLLRKLPGSFEAREISRCAEERHAPKFAEAPKKELARRPRPPIALNSPTAPAEAKPVARRPGLSVRDMAQRAKAAVMSIASIDKPTIVEKLWGKQCSHASLLSYASADASATGSLPTRGPEPDARRIAALRSTDRGLRHLRTHGVSARRHQAGSAFRPRLEARRSPFRRT